MAAGDHHLAASITRVKTFGNSGHGRHLVSVSNRKSLIVLLRNLSLPLSYCISPYRTCRSIFSFRNREYRDITESPTQPLIYLVFPPSNSI